MSVAIPTTEPSVITAGETLAWRITLSDYPASTHTLKYALQRAGAPLITITSTADSDVHAIAVTAALSAAYREGVYLWTAFVETGATRTVVGHGTISIMAPVTGALAGTHATRMLALIESALEGRIPNGLETTNIDGQELQRIPVKDLARLQVQYQAKVANEANALGMKAGLGNRRNHFARFTRPR